MKILILFLLIILIMLSCSREWNNPLSPAENNTIKSIPTEGLVAYYPFNGNANDESGNGNNGTVNGATLTADRFGNKNKAYSFDGVNDYIKIFQSNSLSNLKETTIAYWTKYYKPFSADEVATTICNGPDNVSSNSDGFFTYATRVGILHYLGHWGGAINVSVSVDIDATISLSNQEIYFVVFLASTDSVKTYKNGILNESKSRKNLNISRPQEDWFIGSNGTTGIHPYYLNGIMDDLRIYDRAITEEEIQALYHEGGWNE